MSEDMLPQDSPETIQTLFKDLAKREKALEERADEIRRPIIDRGALVPIGFVITMLSAAMFFGSLVTRVNANEQDIRDIQTKLDTLVTKNDLNNAIKDLKEYINK